MQSAWFDSLLVQCGHLRHVNLPGGATVSVAQNAQFPGVGTLVTKCLTCHGFRFAQVCHCHCAVCSVSNLNLQYMCVHSSHIHCRDGLASLGISAVNRQRRWLMSHDVNCHSASCSDSFHNCVHDSHIDCQEGLAPLGVPAPGRSDIAASSRFQCSAQSACN